MSEPLPVITIQWDWNEVVRLPNTKAWISCKYLNQPSIHDEIKTTVNNVDQKLKIVFSDHYQYISHSILNLVVKHVPSGLKVAFVSPSKIHKIHEKAVLSVSSGEKALAVSSCEGDKLLVWDSRTSEVLLDLKGHGGPVYKTKFFPSGIVIISSGADGSSRIWSAETGVNPATLKGHTMAVTDVCIVEKGRNVVTVSRDGSAKLWDVGESKCLDNIIEGHGTINCCALSTTDDEVDVENEREIGTGNKVLVAGCESGLVICAHVAKRQELFCKQFESACNACTTLEQTVVIGFSNGKIIQLNIKDGSMIREWHVSASPVLSIATLSNQLFICGRQDGTCSVYSLLDTNKNVMVQLTGSDCDGIRDISFNGKWIFAASRDGNIRKYDYNQVNVHFK